MDRLIHSLSERTVNKSVSNDAKSSQEVKQIIEKGNPLGLILNSEQVKFLDTDESVTITTKSNHVNADVYRYSGNEPYRILDNGKNVLYEVTKDQLLLFPHIYEIAGQSEFKRAAMMQKELREFIEKVMKKNESSSQNTIEDSLCIGVSHLGRLFKTLERRAGVQLTWSTEGLPQKFIERAIKASQDASDRSGGGRKVTAEDLVVICFKPSDLQRAMRKKE